MLFRILSLILASGLLSAGEVRIAWWNIHHGVGEDGKLGLARIAALIETQQPDVVALQEVDNKCRRSGGVDQAAELAKRSGMSGA